jgi:spore germination protein GerM
MLARYPQKRKTLFSESVRNAVPSFDRSEEPELDILRNIGYHFYFTCVKEEYPSQVKLFVNQLIEHSQKWFPKFESIMKGVFTVNGKELKHLIGTKLRNNTPRYT